MKPDGSMDLMDAPALTPRIPVATYRLQFHRGFTFDDACRLVPYLATLGITDVYASSYLTARPGSAHGYDVCDHGTLNPELGTPAAYDAFVAALQARGMGQLLDVIPNHMGIAAGCNRWWNDVLENGPSSSYAGFFDIDWDPVKRQLANKVLLPMLGDQYGRALENQELVLEHQDGAFALRYYDTRLPVAPRSSTQILCLRLDALADVLGENHPEFQEYQSIITALTHLPGQTDTAGDRVRERIREKEVIRRRLSRLVEQSLAIRASLKETLRTFNGTPGDPRSFDLLDRLLDDQAYRLAHWRVAGDEINYRRFFDINELAAIRMENPVVFRETHRLILRLIEEGKVTGVRLDHPDGLFDPLRYFLRLQQERLAQAVHARTPDPRRSGRPLYVVVEKILGRGERLPGGWPVHGTTGYEFLNLVGGLFVDQRNEKAMTAAYAAFTGQGAPFADIVYESKKLIVRVSMSSELNVLGHALDRLAERNRHSRDFTRNSLTEALREVIACFPVYRTYIDGADPKVSLQDRACVEVAVAYAQRRNPTTNVSVYDFVRDMLLLRYPANMDEAYRKDQRAFVQKFQQVTAPVTAKGIEDTAFYRYHRLVSLNEVGGDPERFGVSVEEFHAQCQRRLEQWPDGLNASSTHDTKRGEDVRARISLLSEIPREWRAAVSRWHRLNQRHLSRVDGRTAPDRNDEYLLYQTLVGSRPLDPMGPDAAAEFTARIQAYMLKATKEAKQNSSWINPNAAYDEAVRLFVARILDPAPVNRFLADFDAFHLPIARLGMVNSLAQTVLKIAAPGVPDFYQGTELWDLRLVDPDNRRPVEFGRRADLLQGLQGRIEAGDLGSLARELMETWEDGRIKLYAIHRLLAVRRAVPELFQRGAYVPLAARGDRADHLCGFARVLGEQALVVVVPRLAARLTDLGARLPVGPECWGNTRLELPADIRARTLRDLLTGEMVETHAGPGGGELAIAEILCTCPVAVLEARHGRRWRR